MSDSTSATDANFESEVLLSALPVLVDFWGEWCAPCKLMGPMLDEFAQEYAGRVKVVKVEMDRSQKTAMTWHVRSAPTLLLFRAGAVQATHVGMMSKSQLTGMVSRIL